MKLNNRGAIGSIAMVFIGLGAGIGILKVFDALTGGREIKKTDKRLEECKERTHVEKYEKKWLECKEDRYKVEKKVKENEIKFKEKVDKIERDTKKKVKECDKKRKKEKDKYKKKHKELKRKKGCVDGKPFEEIYSGPTEQESSVAEKPDKKKKGWWPW